MKTNKMLQQVLTYCVQRFWEEMHLQISTLFIYDLEVKVTQNITQYPLHHVTYAPAKFKVATCEGF